MRFYYCGKIDEQNRMVLTGYFQPNTKVVFFRQTGDDLVYLTTYDDSLDVPKCLVRKIDAKCRVVIPKEFRKGAKKAWVAKVENGVALELVL